MVRTLAVLCTESDPGRAASAFEPVAKALEAFSPGVEVVRPGLCLMDAHGPARYFGGEEMLLARVSAAVGDRFGVGIADGPFAAALAARKGLIVPPGGCASFVAPFPVTVLDRPELADILQRLGIRGLGEFAALPKRSIFARFGPDGLAAHRLARGLDDRALRVRVPVPNLTVEMALDPPVDRVDAAAFAAKALADRFEEGLCGHGVMCTRVAIHAETDRGQQLTRLWRNDIGFSSSDVSQRLRWQLDGWLNSASLDQSTQGLTRLRLVPDQVIKRQGHQRGFWGEPSDADERAHRGFSRVQAMLGDDAVMVAVLGGGRTLGDRVSLVPWGRHRAPRYLPEAPWPGRMPSPSPSVVFSEPLVARVTDGSAPVGLDRRGMLSSIPARISVAGSQPVAVEAWAGPWTSHQRWWQRRDPHRQARFQLIDANGCAWLLLYQAGRWRAEGSYH